MTYIPRIQLNNLNIPQITFRQASNSYISAPSDFNADSFVTEKVTGANLLSSAWIKKALKSNPEIRPLLRAYGLPEEVHENTLISLKNGHLKQTRIVAAQMYSNLTPEMRQEISMSDIQEAALLHDIGKVLIPENILNKKDKLTPREREIIELHPILGYELLKNSGVSENVLMLVKYHHQNAAGTGYPAIDSDFKYSNALDIIRTADEYTALREDRAYKSPKSRGEALAMIENDVKNGNISPIAYDTLKKVV